MWKNPALCRVFLVEQMTAYGRFPVAQAIDLSVTAPTAAIDPFPPFTIISASVGFWIANRSSNRRDR
jgi:hypothetical protein